MPTLNGLELTVGAPNALNGERLAVLNGRPLALFLGKSIVGRVWNGNQFPPPLGGCVLYLPGPPAQGTSLLDYSGNAKHATISGPLWRQRPGGLWYLDYDGSNDWLRGDDAALPSGANARSVLLWVRIDGVSSHDGGGFFIYGAGGNQQNFGVWEKISGANSYIRFVSRAGDYDPETGTNLNDSKWHHIAMLYDGTNLIAFIDGSQQWSQAQAVNTVLGDYDQGESLWSSNYLNGRLALVQVYNRALLAAEIQNSYNAGRYLFGA